MNKNKYLYNYGQRRKLLAAGATWLTLACAGAVRAQTRDSVQKKVGILSETPSAGFQDNAKLFFAGMQELGWVEGRNLIYDHAYAEGDLARLPDLAKTLVTRQPDVIFARTTQAALAAAVATRTIPIVFVGITNPEQRGLVKSLRQPGGNVTGTTQLGGALGGKRLQLLKEALPKITKVGVLVNTAYSTSTEDFSLIERAAKHLGISIVSAQAADAKAFDAAFVRFVQNGVDAVLATQNPIFTRERGRVVALAEKHHIPVAGFSGAWIDSGALMSYGASPREAMQSSARIVDKVLKGTKPSDIPVEQSTRFELVVNKKAAKSLGISLSQSILILAERVIE